MKVSLNMKFLANSYLKIRTMPTHVASRKVCLIWIPNVNRHLYSLLVMFKLQLLPFTWRIWALNDTLSNAIFWKNNDIFKDIFTSKQALPENLHHINIRWIACNLGLRMFDEKPTFKEAKPCNKWQFHSHTHTYVPTFKSKQLHSSKCLSTWILKQHQH